MGVSKAELRNQKLEPHARHFSASTGPSASQWHSVNPSPCVEHLTKYAGLNTHSLYLVYSTHVTMEQCLCWHSSGSGVGRELSNSRSLTCSLQKQTIAQLIECSLSMLSSTRAVCGGALLLGQRQVAGCLRICSSRPSCTGYKVLTSLGYTKFCLKQTRQTNSRKGMKE